LVPYGQAYLAVPVVEACRRRGLFERLDVQEFRERRWLIEQLHSNETSLGVALEILEALGWIERGTDDGVRRTRQADDYVELGLTPLYAIDPQHLLVEHAYADALSEKIEQCFLGRRTPQSAWAEQARGSIVVPLIAALRAAGAKSSPGSIAGLAPRLAATLTELFIRQGWLEVDALTLTPAGRSVFEDESIRAVACWRPVLRFVEDLLFCNRGSMSLVQDLAEYSRLTILAGHSEGEISEIPCGDWLGRLAHDTSMTAEAFIEMAASVGLFNDDIPARYPRGSQPCRVSVHDLTRRDYVIRHATEADIERLWELEALCWQHTHTPESRIRARLQNYANGQFVLERESSVLGVIYSQRIASTAALMERTAADVHELHDESGSIVQLLAVNVDPRTQSGSYGDQLLEFMLQRCAFMTGIEQVVGVTLCKNYDVESGQAFADYIRLEGSHRDPVLAFHHAHGADVVAVIPGYRPQDHANLTNGVVVAYDIVNRRPRRATGIPGSTYTPSDRGQIAGFVAREAAQLLGLVEADVDIDRPVMEMGLDSADLLKLQLLCEERFGLDLQPGFFFEYSSLRKVVDYIVSRVAPSPAETGSDPLAAARTRSVDDPQLNLVAESDIAVVGMSCKLPGGIESPDGFWRVLASSECVIGAFPRGRRSWPASVDYPGIDQGGFVDDVDAFDAAFFRISPAEAQITDPQQRMLLEVAWACFEDAGIPPEELRGSNTGVFIGASNVDYSRLISEARIEIEAHYGVGSSLAVLANRISYFFDFSGPSLLIDTACSSSLVALHMAVQSLRSGECATALVGGANLICHPDLSISYHKAGMLARDGRCKVFDAKANGYVRAEGAVALLLKPLRAAIADGSQIHGVIRGSATNHGGLAGGLTVPNPQKQKELLIAAWTNAGIVSQDLTYIEAHGTGTSLGDPIELQGVQAAYAEMSSPDRAAVPCGVGSVKSNVGHLEAAAGLAGLLKILLSFRNGQIPASVNLSRLNPKIRLEGTSLYIPEQLRLWDAASRRVAALSSFGSGGTNAHVVVQEYPGSARGCGLDGDHLFVLSAGTQERLHAYAGRVIAWLEREMSRVNLADAIYTWQVGRTAMEVRLAIRAPDHVELLNKLKQWHEGKDVSDCWSGHVVQKGSSVDPVWQTKSGRQLIEQGLREGDLELLGMVWASGTGIDWRKLHGKKCTGQQTPVIISLPTYPFARERYWIDADAGAQSGRDVGVAAAATVHPLLHDNTSDLDEQRFSTRFSGDEFVLADHVVNGAKVLPGVCYLEMARAAVAASTAESAGTIRLRDVVWTSPIVVNAPMRVHTAVFVDEQGELAYDIYSDPAGEGRIVHGHGLASFSADVDVFADLAALRRGADSIEASRCYAAWSAVGIEYGPAFRSIQRLWLGRNGAEERYLLAELELPAALAATREQYLLHPSVMDGALQATMALSLADSRVGACKAHLPFALEEIEIRHRSPARAFVCIRERADRLQKLDIDISDENGRVCARLHGLTSRPLERELATTAPCAEALMSTRLLVPRWEPVAPPQGARWPSEESHVLLVGGTAVQQQAIRARYPRVTVMEADDEVRVDGGLDHVIWVTPPSSANGGPDERLITEQSQGALSGLRLIGSLLRTGYGPRSLGWTVVTWDTQPVVHDDRVRSAHASVHGLVGSLTKEYSHWNIRLVDLPAAGEWPLDEVLTLPADERGDAWAYRGGEWYRQQLLPYEPAAAAPSRWRRGGVYVVVGGAGGIGESFSEYLIRNHRAQLIWIGRRELNVEIQAKIDRLGALGSVPRYVSADAADLEALTRAYREIKAHYGEIHGVVHAAIALLDRGLAQMDEARFKAGLVAKVDVAVRMAQVFAHEPLDFVLFFSSFLSFVKPAGQSNYLAGSTFVDAFAHELRNASWWPVKVMNWGYWGSRGIVASQAYRARMAQNGFGSIEPEDGMAALEQLLAAPVAQMALVKAEGRGLAGLPMARDHVAIARQELPDLARHLSSSTTRHLRLERAAEDVEEVEELRWLMRQLLFSQLQTVGFETTPMYRRWLQESRRVLDGLESVPESSALWSEWAARKGEWLGNASLQAHVRLVEATLRALPEIVTGRCPATDIMFPNASMDLVEGIYRHHPVADYFNAVAADIVAEFVEARLKQDPGADVRIIEFGAGTGGTSDGIFNRLQPHAGRIAEYCYTDISRAFLMHAQESYGPRAPYLTYRLLSVEQSLAAQGTDVGSFDLAIATNVLHATRNIRNTLRNAKAALKRNGVLVLNELLGNSLFMHLTFGLLEGWWLYEDAALRTPGTPLLSPESWRRALESEGFQNTFFPAQAAHTCRQQIIVATSDGVIRQRGEADTQTPPTGRPERAQPPAPRPRRTSFPAHDVDAALRERATAAFKKIVGATLKLPLPQIDSRAELEEYGIDSILVVKMVNKLNGIFAGVTSTLFFEYRTIEALVDHFLETEHEAVMRWVGVAEEASPSDASPSLDRNEREPATVAVPRRPRARTRSIAASAPAEGPERGVAGRSEGIAIIGLSGRYPQSIDIEAFWDNLRDGRDCIVEVPKERWDWQRYFSEERRENGWHFSKVGGFIEGVDEFDPMFFNISPRDAKFIDPQERLFLQHAWMAVEDAGYTRATLQVADEHDLAGQVGVYAGVMYSEYQLLVANARPEDVRMGFAGNLSSIANRVSYALDVHGPSMTVDTMCSSSLTAIHMACQDLKLGRTRLGIAGGVNVSVHPSKYQMLSVGQFLSADGRCQAFGEGGDGFIPAEGVGVVVLKRLRDAERDGDHIYGVIRASSINHGGKTNGYTVPNPQAQASAISRALREAHIDPRHISYVEAHGTGTRLGDPIEIAALTRAFREHTKDVGFCLVGSVKSNIGHCESAAGVAGVTKVLLQMQHQQVVASLHATQPNPYIDFAGTPFVVSQSLRPWEPPVLDGRTLPRVAGISSFGAGGSNAHLIIEEHPRPVRATRLAGNVAIVLSARTPKQLKQRARDLVEFIRPRTETVDFASLAYTLQVGREAMDERFGFVAGSIEQAVDKLDAYVRGDQAIEDAYEGQVRRNKEALAVFGIDDDLQQTVGKWIANQKLGRLLELWARGLELDWDKLYGEVRAGRISLPAYPFERERCWLDVAAVEPEASVTTAALHPLLQRNTSDLDAQRFSSTFTGDEPFVRQGALPAAACLEMARAAMQHSASGRGDASVLELRDLAWGEPIVVEGATHVSVALWRAGEEVSFEVYSGEKIHCQGMAAFVLAAAPPLVDLARVGPLRYLRADVLRDTVLHPLLIDDVLGSPSGLVSLRVFAPCMPEMVAWVRGRDIDLCDAAGNVAVEVRGVNREKAPVIARVIAEPVALPVVAGPTVEKGPRLRREIAFLTQRREAPASGQKRSAIALSVPGAQAATPSTGRARIALSNTASAAPVASAVTLYDCSAGIYAIEIGPSPSLNALDHLLQAIERVQSDSSLKVLMLRGIEHCSATATIDRTFLRSLLAFPYPVVAVLPDGAVGDAFLAAAVCDFMVCSEEAHYGYAGPEPPLFAARFGEILAPRFIHDGAPLSGRDLRLAGWTCPIRPRADVVPHAERLAGTLATKSQDPLRLLKQHLTRSLAGALDGDAAPSSNDRRVRVTRHGSNRLEAALLRTDTVPASVVDVDPAGGRAAVAAVPLQSKVVTATAHPNGVVVVKMEDRAARNMFSDALREGVREAFACIEQTPAYKVVVLTGYDSYFSSGGTKENLLDIQQGKVRFTDLDVFRAALDCKLPVVAAMQGHGIGAGWSMGMFADVVLLSEESRYVSPYMDYGFTPGAGCTDMIPETLGIDLGRESLFTGLEYSGAELKQRGVTIRVLPRAEVLSAAMSVADQIARAPRARLMSLKQELTSELRNRLEETIRLELAMHDATFVGRSDTLARIERNFHHQGEPPPQVAQVARPSIASARGGITATLRTLLANELQMPEGAIDDDVQFVELGLDSINAVTWIRKINVEYQTSIEATKVYAYPTLAQLGRFVEELLEGLEAPSRQTAPAEAVFVSMSEPGPGPESRGSSQKLTSRRRGRQVTRVSGAVADRRPEPVAIIGMAGQFPQANDIDEFWQNIAMGKNCIGRVPPERWDLGAYHQPGDVAPGKTYSPWAGMIDGYDRFDPLFFNLSPMEAESMDPQQRLFLQACWHGIENAGYDAARLSGSRCGVYVGCTVGEYQSLSPEQALSAQGFTGNAMSILAARIAYFLNLQGPCVSIDTACSSSLVAIAQACDSLSAGSSDLALAGGVYAMSGPQMHIKMSQATMLSPDGRCYTFDQRANGFVPGEGVGVVLLKRLSEAERDHDIIHAVIEGWGINQDGKTNGITAPNPESQTRLEQEVYDRYGIDPANIQLIEAHGTGTKLGDPIEVEGLKAAFGKYTRKTGYCALGSVKSNIGHCLTAAGIAGALKLALALEHKQLPPTINFERLNEHIDLNGSPFYVNDRLQEWILEGATRRQAAISSFGFSGTNAHLVVGEYTPPPHVKPAVPARVIVPLSARTPEQLRQRVNDLLRFIRKGRPDLAEVGYTLQVGRPAMEERLGIVVGSIDELAAKLDAWLRGERHPGVWQGQVRRNNEGLGLLGEDEDVREAIAEKWIAGGHLPKLVDYWVRGLSFEWNRLYGAVKPRRISLPVYPFAKQRYWIEARPAEHRMGSGGKRHPLLHRNTCDLKELSYSATIVGDESFLRDHRVHSERVLPGVAYLEMAHAAMTWTWPKQSETDIVELRDIVWLKPVIVREKVDLAISLFPQDDDRIAYEIHTSEVHCQGHAMFVGRPAAARRDVDQLRQRMQQGRLDDADVYRTFRTMGLHYGPAHQGITTIHVGTNELLAELRLPAGVGASLRDYVLHPSITDSALQASIGLLVDPARIPDRPIVPFAAERLRVLSPCTREMAAWVRYASGSRAGDRIVKLDIDLCDEQGNVCIEVRAFTVRAFEADARPARFDEDFYEKLLSDVMSGAVSVDEALQLGSGRGTDEWNIN
jgi:acyl transferase domain-containing protein/enoyl-CoA hydratase/carnithine racemase/acyl carrier protein